MTISLMKSKIFADLGNFNNDLQQFQTDHSVNIHSVVSHKNVLVVLYYEVPEDPTPKFKAS